MRSTREGSVVVLPRPDGKTIDIFTDKGWSRHSVFEYHDGKVSFVRGADLSPFEFKVFKARL